MPLPEPTYLTDEYIRWDSTQTKAAVLATTGTDQTQIYWNHLDASGRDQAHTLIMAYAQKNAAAEALALPVPATEGWAVINFNGSVVGGNSTGIVGGDDVAGFQIANFNGSIGGVNPSGLDPTADVAEVTNITTVADITGSLGGTYFTIDDPTTPYYVWMYIAAIAEVTDIVCGASGTLTTGDYFLLDTPGTNYYVWYNVNAGGGDPAVGGRTGITVVVGAADADTVVASATQTAIDLIGDFGASVNTATVTVTNVTGGDVTDSVDGNTGFVVSNVTQGVDGSTDPAPGGTAIVATILDSDSADAVATAVQTTVNAEADFGASVLTNTVTITNANTGVATDATAGTSGFTPLVTTQGSASTTYTATITVDTVGKPISIVGSSAATFSTLIDEINTDLGASATASISGGDIVVTSATTGATSTVSMADTDLFAALTGFVGFDAAVDGSNGAQLTVTIEVDGTDILISVDADDVDTFTNLLAAVNTDLGANATAAIINGDIDITSATTGSASTVLIKDDGLFTRCEGHFSYPTSYHGVANSLEVFTLNEFGGQPTPWKEKLLVKTIPFVVPYSTNDSTKIYFNHSTVTWKYVWSGGDVV